MAKKGMLVFAVLSIVDVKSLAGIMIYRVHKKKATTEFPKKSTLQFLRIKDFRPLGNEIALIDHITVVVLLNTAPACAVILTFCAILNSICP